jgi:hypothetical protein
VSRVGKGEKSEGGEESEAAHAERWKSR